LQKIDSKPVVNAPIKNARKLPQELYKSLTWGRGTETATTGMRLTDARTVRMPVEGKLRFKSNKKGMHSFFEVSEIPVLTALIQR
jgi:hypothetical protein